MIEGEMNFHEHEQKPNPLHPLTGEPILDFQIQEIKNELKEVKYQDLAFIDTDSVIKEHFNINSEGIKGVEAKTVEGAVRRKNLALLESFLVDLIQEEVKRRSQNN
jgi:hypothetical protein